MRLAAGCCGGKVRAAHTLPAPAMVRVASTRFGFVHTCGAHHQGSELAHVVEEVELRLTYVSTSCCV